MVPIENGGSQRRCAWAQDVSPLYQTYHDEEWGVAVYDDAKLFEMLVLETFQAGLSWLTILKKRESFRSAFDDFDVTKVAHYDSAKVEELMGDQAIVRNRRKIVAAVENARIFLAIQEEFGSFSAYLWGFTGGETLDNEDDILPVRTELSDRLSEDLKRRGMKFVGSVIMYSYLQAVGVVNDHEKGCMRYRKGGQDSRI